MSYIKNTEKALNMLRGLPRISLGNIRDNPGSRKPPGRGRAQHGGDTHGKYLKQTYFLIQFN